MSSNKRKKRGLKKYDFWSDPEGVRLKDQRSRAETSSFPAGCGISTLPAEDLTAMRELCDDILRALPHHGVVPWGDGWVDHKSRAYAMLPNQSEFKSSESLVDHGIRMHDADAALSPDLKVRTDALAKHTYTVTKSFVTIDPLPHQLTAIERMIQQVNEILHRPENLPHLQPYERDAVCLSNLVAIQPNFHNGDDYLPLHLDNPRYDGFGVVIVTVAVWGSADIVLVDDGDAHPTTAPTITSINATSDHSSSTAVNTTYEVKSEDEEVGSGTESTVDLSISRRASLLAPLPLMLPTAHKAPSVACEGGIVYRNGEYFATAEVNGDSSASTNTSPVTTATCITAPSITSAAVQESESRSWAFPLSPGQLYVLSGPARNKCAHGVVVIGDTATNGTDTNTNTTSKRQRGRKKVATAYASTLPNLNMLANLTNSTTNSASVSTTTTTSATTSASISDQSSTSASTTTTNTTSNTTARQPNAYNGRVSLNFRFGLHTPDQAYEDVDRHWG